MPRYIRYLPTSPSSPADTSAEERIKRAARRLFFEKGYHATTTREIAQAAGVTLGLIPYYFKSKENLAATICYDIMEQFYQKIDFSRMEDTSSGVKLYLSQLLIFEYQFMDPTYGYLLSELTATTDLMDSPSTTARRISDQVIREYGLTVSPEENEMYLVSLIGALKHLVKAHISKKLSITFTQLTDLLISDYFFNIGLPDEEIAKIISKGQQYYEAFYRQHPVRFNLEEL